MPMVLEGITVIELATGQQGPVAGALLADIGADVIKIEDKDLGDPGRNIRTETPGQEPFPLSYYFENNNRNKRGVALDYGTEAGREVVRNLVSRSDIFLSNFPIPTLADMGLDYPRLSAANEKLIYAVCHRYGPDRSRQGQAHQRHRRSVPRRYPQSRELGWPYSLLGWHGQPGRRASAGLRHSDCPDSSRTAWGRAGGLLRLARQPD